MSDFEDDYAAYDDDEGFGEIRVNFSDKEAGSEAFESEPLPSGKYPCTITDVQLVPSKSAKNKGKPMYKLEVTVHEDFPKYGKRKMWTNICLWDGALYSLAQLMKSTGFVDEAGRPLSKVPPADAFMDLDVLVVAARKGKRQKTDEQGNKIEGEFWEPRTEISGFKPLSGKVESVGKQTEGSLLA